MNHEQIQKSVRKSEMAAQSQYDYGKIVFPREEFLPCTMKEDKEEIQFFYERKDYKSFGDIKSERRDIILINLIDCGKFVEINESYQISLNPENIFYDIHNRVFLMERDVYGRGEEFSKEKFLMQYKSLIGHALQKRYSFADYFEGGIDLLRKDKFLAQIADLSTVEEVMTCLYEEYKKLVEHDKNTKVLVNKKTYRRKRLLLGFTSGLLGLSIVWLGFTIFYTKPYENAVINANRNYLEKNYSGVIDSFQKIKLERLNVPDKYILANSYIQCENLTGEQKENIMNALSLETNEKVLDYWISLGKLDVIMAEDIAQQVSDNDLLLYAYLKEKSIVEEDTTLSGNEKETTLEGLQGKIDKLMDLLKNPEKMDEDTNPETVPAKQPKEEDTGSLDDIVDTNS